MGLTEAVNDYEDLLDGSHDEDDGDDDEDSQRGMLESLVAVCRTLGKVVVGMTTRWLAGLARVYTTLDSAHTNTPPQCEAASRRRTSAVSLYSICPSVLQINVRLSNRSLSN